MRRIAAMLAAVLLGAASPAPRLNYLGAWRITGSQPAPWVKPGHSFGRRDIDHLDGRQLTFSSRAIAAPAPLACNGPHYEVKQVGPDYLFQGNLTRPAAQARALGYAPTITTLETGCEIDFHFIDADAALFALNNRLYRIERVKGAR